MSAEMLRKAASLMRERAEAASPSPWAHETGNPGMHHILADDGTFVCDLEDGYAENGLTGHDVPADDDAEHIASWHPAVALAVADWLEDAAAAADDDVRAYAEERARGKYPYWSPSVDSQALAVARAYLGSDA